MGLDFSEHELLIHETDDVKIHTLKKPGTYYDMIKFINVEGLLLVSGDYGRWSFCRSFIPTPEGRVSDYYWVEKLEIDGEQKGVKYSSEATEKELQNRITEIEELKKEGEYYDKEYLEYLNECLEICDDEFGYTHFAYRNIPNDYDYEIIPYVEVIKPRLRIIFDAFDEICYRLKNNIDGKK